MANTVLGLPAMAFIHRAVSSYLNTMTKTLLVSDLDFRYYNSNEMSFFRMSRMSAIFPAV